MTTLLTGSEAAELRRRFMELAEVWEARAASDVKFAEGVPEDVRDAMLDSAGDMLFRARDIQRILAEVPATESVA